MKVSNNEALPHTLPSLVHTILHNTDEALKIVEL